MKDRELTSEGIWIESHQGYLIKPDSEPGKRLGLTSDVFSPECELFQRGRDIYIQYIDVREEKRRQGHFNALVQRLWNLGFVVKVPNPYPHMARVLERKGFEVQSEQSLSATEVELTDTYYKAPPGS